jgi:aspartyl-tRNA(Asn)/glutamyl-tRNA(Gln) amidotransferase subunit B
MSEHKLNQMWKKDDLQLKIGLEIHAQMNTDTKLFSQSPNETSIVPNKNITLFDIGVPGILPKMNENAVKIAVKTGLAINCNINKKSQFDRKHYQYPDLPFGYQITQFFFPICQNGLLELNSGKKVRINRIHMECDAGKMIHTSKQSLLDYNRAGVPLMEIVTEPDMNSALDVEQFLKELILILEYIDTCNCNMELGNLRVDVNMSLNHKDLNIGTRVELKNLNSIKFIRDAIAVEFDRQLDAINNGTYDKEVKLETRGYDSDKRITYSMRSKETYMEYRYMPDRNLPPLVLSDDYIESIRRSIEVLPGNKRKVYASYLPEQIYDVLINNQKLGKIFDQYEKNVENKSIFANLLVGDLLGILNRSEKELNESYVNIAAILTNYLDKNTITMKTAKLLLEECVLNDLDPHQIINDRNLKKITNIQEIEDLLKSVISEKSPQWQEFIKGNDKLFSVFLGLIIKKTNGQADADITTNVIHNYKNQCLNS